MRRCLLLLVPCLLLAVPAAGAGGKAKGKIQITWHGQSFFEIRTPQGTNLVIDPHAIPEYGLERKIKADIVLMSHEHNDHTQLGVIVNAKEKDIKIIRGLEGKGRQMTWKKIDEKIKDVHIRSVPSYHDDMEGMRYGLNTIFILDIDGWRIVHLGDLGHMLSEDQIKQLGKVDVLMIPVGGVYTLNGSDAKKVVAQIKPKEYIIPMHYGTVIYSDLLTNAEFLEDQPKERIQRLKHNAIELDRNPARARPTITVLHYWPQVKKGGS